MCTEGRWHTDDHHIYFGQSFQVARGLERLGFAHCGDAAIADMFKWTFAKIEPSDFFFVDIKSKDAKVLCRRCEHQRQPDVAHADNAYLRAAILNACAQNSMIFQAFHFGFLRRQLLRHPKCPQD